MFDFSSPINRYGTWCTQWDYVADRFGAADLLPFTISDMDFATAPCIIDAINKRVAHGVFGYSRWQNPAFLSAIIHWYASRFACKVNSDTIIYGPSVIYMVAEFIRQWSARGEGVVVHTPAYDAFYKVIAGNHRQFVAVPLIQQHGGWHSDMPALAQALAQASNKILLLCSPHNPTGKVWQRSELLAISQLCQQHQVSVISDEIHMDMVWQERQHIPWNAVAGHRHRWAVLTSASKSFNIPAFNGAYGLVDDDDARNNYLRALKERDGLSSPSIPALVAHIAAYNEGAHWLDALRCYIQTNMHYLATTLNQAFPLLQWQPPESTYLAWIDLRALNIDERLLQKKLIEEQKIAIMPGYTYGEAGRGYIRLNVGCPLSKLERGVQGLIAAIKSLRA